MWKTSGIIQLAVLISKPVSGKTMAGVVRNKLICGAAANACKFSRCILSKGFTSTAPGKQYVHIK